MSSNNSANRVFMIGWEYPPHNSGGLGVACEGLTEALSLENTKIYFSLPYAIGGGVSHMDVVTCIDPSWIQEGMQAAAPFTAYSSSSADSFIDLKKKYDSHELHALPESELEQRVHQYASLVKDRAKALKNEFDLIHAHDWMSYPAAMEVKKQTGKPFIAHIHSTEYDRIPNGYGSNYIMNTEYNGMQLAETVVAVSNYTKHILINKYNISPHKIEVVHNGVTPPKTTPDPGKHHFAHKRPVVVFMGRLTMQKGADYFIKLARAVLQENPTVLFIVAGAGDMYQQLLLSTADHKISASTVFSGFIRDAEREKLLDRADVFVMPSLSEPFGLVALEAAQRHTPVIISKTAGVSEVLSGSIQADFWDVHGMAAQISQLLRDTDHSQNIVARQLQDLKKTTWQSAAQKIKNVYHKTLTL